MIDLKKKLIAEIEKIDDQVVLEQLTQLVTLSDQELRIEFTKDQIAQIEDSKDQIRNGESFKHSDVMNSI